MDRNRITPEINITRAGATDAQEILQLQRLAYLSEAEIYGDYEIAPLRQTLDEMKADIESQVVLKASADGWIIGSVRGVQKGGCANIGRLIVHPEHQNRGLGRCLMEALEAWFPLAERYELFTGEHSHKNLHLYHKLGYRITRHQAAGEKVTLVFMEKYR